MFNFRNELDFSKSYEYNSDSRLINATVSALSLAYDYDDESVGSLSYSLAQGATKSFSYQYDENGNIVSEQVTVDGVSADITAYEYDDDNQLVSAENSSTKWTYSYDGRGNLTAENEYSVSLNESGEKVYTPIENDTYTYDTAWKDKLTSYNGQTISYDASGNPTSYLGHSLSWTMGRQLASYDNIAYSYNESGIRTRKTVGENTTEFYLNGTNIIYQTDGTSDIYFFYDRNNELVGFKYSGNNYFYVKNQMGDITDIADENGIIVASYSYDPWGSVLSVTGSDTAIANLNPFRYRSYYYDSDIQMYYLQSRYYDPGVGRFINCDDVNYIGYAETINSYNAFAYCENCPVMNIDPYGCATINIKVKYFYNSFAGRDSQNRNVYVFTYLKQGCNYNYISSDLGKTYFTAILTVWDRKSIKINLCYNSSKSKKGIKANKKYLCAFVKEDLCLDLAQYAISVYRDTYSKKYRFRTDVGIELEILLHIYMYYFDIDADKNYRSSKEIDIDNNRDGLAIEIAATARLINLCKNAINSGKENRTISNMIKTVFKIMGR